MTDNDKEPSFFEEPKIPIRSDYGSDESFNFAMESYKHKLEVFTARMQWKREREAAEANKSIVYPDFNYFCPVDEFGKRTEPFKPAKVAQWLHHNDHFKLDKRSGVFYYGYVETGLWKAEGEIRLQQILTKILGEENKKTYYENILHCLKSLSYEDVTFSKRFAVKNGLLNLDTEEPELTELNLGEMAYYQLPIKYDPDAKCPEILRVLIEIVSEKQLPLLLEAIGNIFIIGMLYHKITIFIGSGANGKGTVLELIKRLVGESNVSEITLQSLCNDKYERAECYHKLVNLGRDIPQTKIGQTGYAKMMSGDDPMTMQHKYGHPFVANPDELPKQFYSCNQLPPSDDDTDAWYRRQNLIAFNTKFIPGQNAVERIADKLAENEEEMSGFFNLVLEARKKLLINHCFSANEDIEANRQKYVENSRPSQAYIEANLVYEQNKFVPEKELWSKVGQWCQEKGIAAPKNKGAFTQELTKIIPQVQQTSERIEGRSTHVYMNLKYKEPDVAQPTLDNLGQNGKSVTTVTTVTTSPILLHTRETQNIEKIEPPVTTVTPVTSPEFFKDRYCLTECKNANTEHCPIFPRKIEKDALLPLRCYGYAAPNPGEDA